VNPCSADFVVANSAEEAVDRLAALHQQATSALSQALKRYLKERVKPDAAQHAQFRYPELRLTYQGQGEVPASVRAYAKVQVPGTYSVTVTHPAAFRNYLLEQLRPLMQDFTVRVEVGVSQQNIPYPYVVEQGDELAGSGVTAAELARVFPSTDLSAATDGTADGLYDWENTDPLPLALFDAARVDFSLRRLVHYTGSDWRHVQPWILLTNYHRYVDQFVRHGLDVLQGDSRFVRMVLPGNVVIARAAEEAKLAITKGASIAGTLRQTGEFPPLVTHMIAVGEASGELDTMLARVADVYDQLVQNAFDRMLAVLPPVAIMLVGGVVVLIILSTLLPLLNLTSAL